MNHQDMLDVLDRIDENVIERNTKKRCALWSQVNHTSRQKSGRKQSITIVLLAATLVMTMVAFGALLIMYLADHPVDPPSSDEVILSIEKTATDGDKSVYTITYKNGKTATLDITDKAPEGSGAKITGVTFDENSNVYLSLATGKLLSMGKAVGQTKGRATLSGYDGRMALSFPAVTRISAEDTNTKDVTTVAGVSVDETENMAYHLNNGKHLALGKVHEKGEGHKDTSMSMACINESGELVLGFASGETMNLGRVVGKDGKDGVGIEGIQLSSEGELSVTLTNGTVLNLGNIKGQDGIGIAESKINDAGELVLTYTDGNTVNLGRVVGEKGENGVGIASINISDAGELTISLTDGTNLNLGVIKGQDGKSAYELYKEKFGYEGTEEEWLFDLVNGNLATKIKHPVIFDSDGGTEVPMQEVEEGSKVTEPEMPTKLGYSFLGWYYGDELWSFAGYSVTEPITLKAKWKINTYSITYSEVYPVGAKVGDTDYTVHDETVVKNLDYYIGDVGGALEARTFLGWTYGDVTTPTKDVVIPEGTTGNLIITAHWDVQEEFQFTTTPFKNSCIRQSDSHVWWTDFTLLAKCDADVYAVCDGVITSVTQQSNGRYTLVIAMDYDHTGKSLLTYTGLGTLASGVVKDAHVSEGDILGKMSASGEGLGAFFQLKSNISKRVGSDKLLYNFFAGSTYKLEQAMMDPSVKAVGAWIPQAENMVEFDVTVKDGYLTLTPKSQNSSFAIVQPPQSTKYLVIKYRTTLPCDGPVYAFDWNHSPYVTQADWETTGDWAFTLIDVSQVPDNQIFAIIINFFDPGQNTLPDNMGTFDLAGAVFFDSREAAENFIATFG